MFHEFWARWKQIILTILYITEYVSLNPRHVMLFLKSIPLFSLIFQVKLKHFENFPQSKTIPFVLFFDGNIYFTTFCCYFPSIKF